jgi:glutaredoxin 3
LDEDFTEKEFYDKFGLGSAFPQVICDDKTLGGCINTIKNLQENNLL